MRTTTPPRRDMRGFTLVELMIGMLLGLLVTGAAIGIFLSNQQTYRTTEGLGRAQEGLRTAFELMARDLRAAGGNACNDRPGSFTNALTSGTGEWWGEIATGGWDSAIKGYSDSTGFSVGAPAFGTGEGQRLSGSAALDVFSSGDGAASVSADGGSTFTLNASDQGFVSGDVLIVCDTNTSAIFNASAVSGTTVSHPTSIAFAANSTVSRFNASRWYVAYNALGTTSLYRARVYAGNTQQEEIADNVTALGLEYLVDGSAGYVDADEVTDWSTVLAIRISLTLASPDKVGSDGKVLTRSLVHVVELRNRNT
jgi:type IV pilus assembly protein PilW